MRIILCAVLTAMAMLGASAAQSRMLTIVGRPVVRLNLCIAGYNKLAKVNLANRTGMSFPLLVGRSFMKAGGLVIDSGQKYVGRPVCPGVPN